MKLYVGNLPSTFTDQDLEDLFSQHGTVKSAKIIIDHATGRSRGFGFVEMGSKDEGLNAIKELDKKVVGNNALVVNEARPQQKRDNPMGGSPFKKTQRYGAR